MAKITTTTTERYYRSNSNSGVFIETDPSEVPSYILQESETPRPERMNSSERIDGHTSVIIIAQEEAICPYCHSSERPIVARSTNMDVDLIVITCFLISLITCTFFFYWWLLPYCICPRREVWICPSCRNTVPPPMLEPVDGALYYNIHNRR